MQRAVAPATIGAAMGTFLLLRQLGASVALVAADAIYVAGVDSGHREAAATATGVFVIALAGAALAAGALSTLPGTATRFAAVPVPA
jgi:hypothetical protein